MSVCTTATCPHDRGAFVWLADGPWDGGKDDPDTGRYPWVHDTTMTPGHLQVCELMPFATAEEAGEVCACSHETRRHPASGPVPDVPAVAARMRPCVECGCTDFRHRAEDLEYWRAAQRGPRPEPAPQQAPAAAAAVGASRRPAHAQLALFGGAA